MKLRIASDIHTEMWDGNNLHKFKRMVDHVLPVMEDDKEQILILAGDIGSCHKKDNFRLFFDLVAPRFKLVYGVPGNHEGYGGELNELVKEDSNITFTDTMYIQTKDYNIAQATLWTDFNKHDETIMKLADKGLNDYKHVRKQGSSDLITAEYIYERHKFSKRYLQRVVDEDSIVITHHAPSEKSVHSHYAGSPINYGFFSDLESLILQNKPKIWCHGHMHNSSDYMIGDTRVVCNPVGYPMEHRIGDKYNPKLVIEL